MLCGWGLATVHAFNKIDYTLHQFYQYLNANTKAALNFEAGCRWFGFVVDQCTIVFICTVNLVVIILTATGGLLSSDISGILLYYCSSLGTTVFKDADSKTRPNVGGGLYFLH